MLENLFIIFPPGAGGNHLANLVSLSGKYSRAVDFNQYGTGYQTAHFTDNELNLAIDENGVGQLSQQNNVLCGHLASYIWFNRAGFAERFPNKKFVVITAPEHDTLAFNRASKLCSVYTHPYSYHELNTLYSIECLSALYNEHDWFQISAEDIFQPLPDKILSFLKQDLWLDVDYDFVKDIHAKWFADLSF